MQRLLLLWALLILCACQPESAEDLALDSFKESFIRASEAESIEPMLRLYELEGSAEHTVRLLKSTLSFELGMPIRSIEFEPLSGAPEEEVRFTHEGIQYGPTLEPRLRMHVRYKTEDHFESRYTIGLNIAGDWRIISSRPIEPIDQPAK